MANFSSEFRERFAYGMWVRQLWIAADESERAFAELAGLGYDWLQKWKRRADAPNDRMLSRALASAMGVPERWLLDDAEAPPRPELWEQWIAAARGERAPERSASTPAHRLLAKHGQKEMRQVHVAREEAAEMAERAKGAAPARKTGGRKRR